MKQTDWYASPSLKRLYDRYAEERGLTQKEFAKQSGIGTQPYISMLLCRDRPLNLDNAVRFARALRCSIYDVCPEMADYIVKEALPVLGKALRRAAVFAALSIGSTLFGVDNKLIAAPLHPDFPYKNNSLHIVRRLLRRILSFITNTCIKLDTGINDLAQMSDLRGKTEGWTRRSQRLA